MFLGQHYTAPVELIDIFPTVNDILLPPKYNYGKHCKAPGRNVQLPDAVCNSLQGKSLVRAVLGDVWDKSPVGKKVIAAQKASRKPKMKSKFSLEMWSRILINGNGTHINTGDYGKWRGSVNTDRGSFATGSALDTNSVVFDRAFSITQCWRCSPKDAATKFRNTNLSMSGSYASSDNKVERLSSWGECDRTSKNPDLLYVMGYSMRTQDYRYTAWFHYDRDRALPITDMPLFEEEVSYDKIDCTSHAYTQLLTSILFLIC